MFGAFSPCYALTELDEGLNGQMQTYKTDEMEVARSGSPILSSKG